MGPSASMGKSHYYRSQRSCGKVMVLHLSVILFTGRVSAQVEGACPGEVWQTPLPPGPEADTPSCPVHAGIHTPLPSACLITPLPAQCIRSTSGRYESYWNTFLLQLSLCVVTTHQQNCRKVMFLQASVRHSVHRGGRWVLNPGVGNHPISHFVHGGHPRILRDTVDKRAARILLEWFFVMVKSITWN